MKKTVLSLFVACSLAACNNGATVDTTADYNVVPLPQEINLTEGAGFQLNGNTVITYGGNEALKPNAQFLAGYIKESTGLELQIAESAATQTGAISLAIGNATENKEGYNLTVNADGVAITSATPAGVFYGIQTLRKSLPVTTAKKFNLPAVDITDHPRFSYRGAHLDVSRHYFTKDSIKRFIDMLAMHNMNRFHWHLTDDKGWRIEIKK